MSYVGLSGDEMDALVYEAGPDANHDAIVDAVRLILAERLASVAAVLDGPLSNHHDGCDAWRGRDRLCNCWRAELQAVLDPA